MNSLKMVDLFAGVGGIRLGFQQAADELNVNLKNVFTSEIDNFAKKTYLANFKENNMGGDITTTDENNIPDHDILCAGFPCQPFSQAGKQRGFGDTRGTLFFDILRIARHHTPKILFLENVKRLKSHDKGNTFSIIKRELEELGYRVFSEVLNARNFGIPQNRERIFIVAIHNYSGCFHFPTKGNKEPKKLSDILLDNDLIDPKYTLSDKLWEYLRNRKISQREKGNGFGYSLFNHNSEYVNTISARYYKDGSEILIEQHGRNPRKLTPRESLLIQGFPSSFNIVCSDTQTYKQAGNSVCVNIIRQIALQILQLNFFIDSQTDSG